MVRTAAAAVISVERFFELSLLGLVASGYLAVVSSGYLDTPTAVLAGAGLCLRALLITGAVRLDLSSRVIAAVTVAYIAFYPIDYAFLSQEFLPATVHLVFFLAIIKILTASSGRDHIFVAVIAFLELLAASLLSTNLNFFISLALFLLFGVATFSSAEIRRSTRRPRNVVRQGLHNFHWRLAGLTLSVALGILILTACLFFLLPRTAQAAFQHLVPQRYRIAGFSNEVVLGQIGQIQKRTTPVMHVRLSSAEPPGAIRWRGVALTYFNGRRWYNQSNAGVRLDVQDGLLKLSDGRQGAPGRRINYEVQLNASASDALFFAGSPEFLQINRPVVIRTLTDSYRLPFGTAENVRYGAWGSLADGAAPADAPAEPAPPSIRQVYLQLPRLDSRIAKLAQTVSKGSRTDEQRARALEQYLRTHYGYTTDLLSKEVPDPLAHFLFERRKGHCEYFASSLAVMLRTLGIPSRVVNGFQNGVLNPISGWYVVRGADAHSWVEAWLPGRGWTTLDATPAVPGPATASLWTRLGFYLDAAETFWDEWVVNYDLDRQLTLASRMESSGRSFSNHWMDHLGAQFRAWKNNAAALGKQYGSAAAAFLVLIAAGVIFGPRVRVWWRTRERVREAQRGAARPSDATLLYTRMLGILKRQGFEKPGWLTPSEFVRVLPASETSMLVGDFTSAYNALRFGGDTAAAVRMVSLLERLQG